MSARYPSPSAKPFKHFAAVQSIVRVGLRGADPEFRRQVERLRDRLARDGGAEEAAALDRLLAEAARVGVLEPTAVQAVVAGFGNERLSEGVQPPIDRESGAPLCEIDLAPWSTMDAPLHAHAVACLVEDLIAEWRCRDQLQRLDVDVSRTCLIYGPPGSGKTMTARYLAGLLRLPLITARIDGLVSSFLGTSARNIANLFNFANRYDCVLLLDEFDALAKVRDDPQEIGEIKRVVNSLLQNLDARAAKGVTIAITNHSQLLDPAVWRRFEAHVHLGPPDEAGREALLSRFLAPLEAPAPLVRVGGRVTEGWTGAQIKSLCQAMKRWIAVRGAPTTPPSMFEAMRTVMMREAAVAETPAATALAQSVDAFIAYANAQPDLKLTQTELAALTGMHQTTMSRRAKQVKKQAFADAET